HHRRGTEAGEGQLPLVVPRQPRSRLGIRPRRPACRAGAVRRRPEPDQYHPGGPREGHPRRGAAGGEEIPGAVEPHLDRSPAGGGRFTVITTLRIADCGLRITHWGLGIGLALLALPAAAQAPPPRPAVGPERPFQLAPRVERTLPNGLRVIATKQAAIQKVSITLTVLSGFSSDPADLTGLASLTADLIQEGTKTRNSRQIRREAFGMGGSLTAAAQDFTSINARGLSEFAPKLIDLVADVAMNPTIPEEEVAILKQQHLQQAQQQKASPQFLANRTFRAALFGSHPYARTAETEASLGRMDRAKLVAFHRDHYRPNNAFLLIVGAIEPEAAIAAAEKSFGAWTKGEVPAPAFTPPPSLSGRKLLFVQRPNSVQSSISLGNIAVK